MGWLIARSTAVFELTVISGPDKSRVYRLSGDVTVIGREENIEVSLTDRSASRRHARITKVGRSYEIEDLGSGNGTLVNAEPIAAAKKLHEGDLIIIGKDTMRFHQHEESRTAAADGEGFRTDATITMRDLQRELTGQHAAPTEWDEDQRSRNDMAAIFRVGQSFNGLQTTDDLYPKIIEVILAELPRADRATLLLSEGEEPEPVVQLSQARKNTIRITDTLYRHSLARTAMQQQQAMLIRDPVNDERFQGADTIIASSIRSAICVPVLT